MTSRNVFFIGDYGVDITSHWDIEFVARIHPIQPVEASFVQINHARGHADR